MWMWTCETSCVPAAYTQRAPSAVPPLAMSPPTQKQEHHRQPATGQSIDESIVAFATVREQVMSSRPSFGDYQGGNREDHVYDEDIVPCMVEVQRGSPNKYEVDKDTGMLMLDRVLHSAVHYPGDYGYIPSTLCGDGDPLDVLIITPYAAQMTFKGLEPGTVANVRIVGLMDMEDESGRDEKVIGVLDGMKTCSHIQDLSSIPPHLKREIQHFFESYKELELKKGKPKWARVLGWYGKQKALEVLKESREAYEAKLAQDQQKAQRFNKLSAPNLLHARNHGSFENGEVLAYISAAAGGTCSYRYRHDTSFRHYRYSLDMPYVGDVGFITQTWQKDLARPLEVHVTSVFPLVPESMVQCRVVGALERSFIDPSGNWKVDYKVVAMVTNDPRTEHTRTLSQINTGIVEHFEKFYEHSGRACGNKNVKIIRRLDRDEAIALVASRRQSYSDFFEGGRAVVNAPNLWCLPWGGDEVATGGSNASVTAVIECPKHSCNKFSFKREYGTVMLERPLYSATHWPGNYGFIPQTVAEDGNPVNILVLSNHPLTHMSLCECQIVGAVRCLDEKGPDVKVIAVPKKEPRMREWKDVENVPGHMRQEIENFFNTYKALESEWRFCNVEGWKNREETLQYLRLAHTRFFLFVLPMEKVDSRLRRLEDENSRLRQALLTTKTKM